MTSTTLHVNANSDYNVLSATREQHEDKVSRVFSRSGLQQVWCHRCTTEYSIHISHLELRSTCTPVHVQVLEYRNYELGATVPCTYRRNITGSTYYVVLYFIVVLYQASSARSLKAARRHTNGFRRPEPRPRDSS